MSITLGGQTYTNEQIIAAIAASDNEGTTVPARTLDEVNGVLQAVLHRLSALEDRLPIARAGYGVTTIPGTASNQYIVQSLDEQGRTILTTFTVPNS